jgi:hypothetical protein
LEEIDGRGEEEEAVEVALLHRGRREGLLDRHREGAVLLAPLAPLVRAACLALAFGQEGGEVARLFHREVRRGSQGDRGRGLAFCHLPYLPVVVVLLGVRHLEEVGRETEESRGEEEQG